MVAEQGESTQATRRAGTTMITEPRQEMSRRELLAKGAAAGTVAWILPLVISSPAFAATAKCLGSKPCTTFYFVKINGDGTIAAGVADGSCGLRTITKCDNTAATLQYGGGPPSQIVSTVSGAGSLSFTLSAGSLPLLLTTKYGQNCHDYTYNENTNQFVAQPPATGCTASVTTTGSVAGGLTITVLSSGSGCGISHVNLYFCK